jgi:DNA-binding LacI/PurR family transcriptional regulator
MYAGIINLYGIRCMNVRIKDIAKHLNVAESTVSRALSDHPRISKSTKKKVTATAKKLNYRPNLIAKSLKLKSTNTIGLIIGDITNPFYPDIVKSAEDIAHKNNFNIILCNSDYDPDKEIQYLNILMGKRVDGMLITPLGDTPLIQRTLQQNSVPFVFIDCKPNSKNGVNCVFADLEFGAYTAIKYLIELGHTQISLINGPKTNSPCQQLESGFIRAMDELGIKINRNYLRECNLKLEGGYNAMKDLLKHNRFKLPTAALFISDKTAIGAYEAIEEVGMHIPEDISIIGYDDIPEAKHISPSLTTISQPKSELGEKAINLLLKELKNKSPGGHQSIRLLPEMVIRNSTAHPK